jgi:hypothetical protein
MSKKARVPINVLATSFEPSGQYAGDLYYNSVDSSVFVYTGSVWNVVGGGDIDGGLPTSNYTGVTVTNGGTP